MGAQLMANIRTTLVFYRRNNLLLVMTLIILGVGALTLVPALIFEHSTLKFALIRRIFSGLDGMATVIAGSLGMVAISYHLRNRCLKMVITKPCAPEAWLLAVFLSAILVTAAIYLSIFLVVSSLFLVWGVPFQAGLPFLTLLNLLGAVVILTYVGMLSVMLHPVLAVVVAVFFQDGIFRELMTLAAAGAQGSATGLHKFLLQALEVALSLVYVVLPSFGLFSDKLRGVSSSYRVSGSDWQYLSLTFAYTVLLSTLFYLIGAWALRRKRLI